MSPPLMVYEHRHEARLYTDDTEKHMYALPNLARRSLCSLTFLIPNNPPVSNPWRILAT